MSDEPSADVIARLKEKHPDRALHLVEVVHGEDSHYFVMTGANHYEYKKFNDDVLDADEKSKSKSDRSDKLHLAVKIAALAQIRWPERPEVEKLFHDKPGIVSLFVDKIHEHAGSSAEVRSKKL